MAVMAVMALMAVMAETRGADGLATEQMSLCQVHVIRDGPDGCTPNGYALPLPAAALPMKGPQTWCMTPKRHSLLQPPVRREGRIKIRKASRQRSVFLAVNAVNATKRRHLPVHLSSNHNLYPHSHTPGRIADLCRMPVCGLWHTNWRNVRPVRSVSFIDHSFHRTAEDSNGTGRRHEA